MSKNREVSMKTHSSKRSFISISLAFLLFLSTFAGILAFASPALAAVPGGGGNAAPNSSPHDFTSQANTTTEASVEIVDLRFNQGGNISNITVGVNGSQNVSVTPNEIDEVSAVLFDGNDTNQANVVAENTVPLTSHTTKIPFEGTDAETSDNIKRVLITAKTSSNINIGDEIDATVKLFGPDGSVFQGTSSYDTNNTQVVQQPLFVSADVEDQQGNDVNNAEVDFINHNTGSVVALDVLTGTGQTAGETRRVRVGNGTYRAEATKGGFDSSSGLGDVQFKEQETDQIDVTLVKNTTPTDLRVVGVQVQNGQLVRITGDKTLIADGQSSTNGWYAVLARDGDPTHTPLNQSTNVNLDIDEDTDGSTDIGDFVDNNTLESTLGLTIDENSSVFDEPGGPSWSYELFKVTSDEATRANMSSIPTQPETIEGTTPGGLQGTAGVTYFVAGDKNIVGKVDEETEDHTTQASEGATVWAAYDLPNYNQSLAFAEQVSQSSNDLYLADTTDEDGNYGLFGLARRNVDRDCNLQRDREDAQFAGDALKSENINEGIFVDPNDPGVTATHNVCIDIGEEQPFTGSNLDNVSVDYVDTEDEQLDLTDVDISDVTAGIDNDSDGQIEIDLTANLTGVTLDSSGEVITFHFDGTRTLPSEDRLILRYEDVGNPDELERDYETDSEQYEANTDVNGDDAWNGGFYIIWDTSSDVNVYVKKTGFNRINLTDTSVGSRVASFEEDEVTEDDTTEVNHLLRRFDAPLIYKIDLLVEENGHFRDSACPPQEGGEAEVGVGFGQSNDLRVHLEAKEKGQPDSAFAPISDTVTVELLNNATVSPGVGDLNNGSHSGNQVTVMTSGTTGNATFQFDASTTQDGTAGILAWIMNSENTIFEDDECLEVFGIGEISGDVVDNATQPVATTDEEIVRVNLFVQNTSSGNTTPAADFGFSARNFTQTSEFGTEQAGHYAFTSVRTISAGSDLRYFLNVTIIDRDTGSVAHPPGFATLRPKNPGTDTRDIVLNERRAALLQTSVEFNDQNSTGESGSTLNVASATLADEGFVVIENSTGDRVGATGVLNAGTTQDAPATLDVSIETGTFTAVAVQDSNDNGVLDNNDQPFMEGGARVTDDAQITVGQNGTNGFTPGTPEDNYDQNDNGQIDDSELGQAITCYVTGNSCIDDQLTDSEMGTLITEYILSQ